MSVSAAECSLTHSAQVVLTNAAEAYLLAQPGGVEAYFLKNIPKLLDRSVPGQVGACLRQSNFALTLTHACRSCAIHTFASTNVVCVRVRAHVRVCVFLYACVP